MNRQAVIGVWTRRSGRSFIEPLYFRGLFREGRKLGAHVYFFSEEDVREEQKSIYGFTPDNKGRWVQAMHPWPDIVINRRRSLWTPAFRRLQGKGLFVFTSSKYAMKGKATRMLANMRDVSRWIPKTFEYSPDRLLRMMERFPIVYVKPGNGTGGGSVVRIAREGDHWNVWGRERRSALRKARLHTAEQVRRWVDRWVVSQRVRKGTFIVQQGLNLELVPNRVVDHRLLIQKNGKGEWEMTGIATRIGGPNSPTTNLLYGDGKASKFSTFMTQRFGMERASLIRKECRLMAFSLARSIEARFGPMMEFGMDVGIEPDGKVWLIEANPKPSRDVFLKSGERDVYNTAVRRPLEYALHLVRERAR